MKGKYILLVIGVLGIVSSVYLFITGEEIYTTVSGFVCSAGLIYGYYETKKYEESIDCEL